jgi:hypothetical protein
LFSYGKDFEAYIKEKMKEKGNKELNKKKVEIG